MSSKTTSSKGANKLVPYSESAATKLLAIVTPERCKRIAMLDASDLSSDPDEYVRENYLTYYTLINTWILMVREGSQRGALELLGAIDSMGLLPTIRACDEYAAKLVESQFSYSGITNSDYVVHGIIGGARTDKVALQWLRYPKRFSPASADKLYTRSIENFLFFNRENRRHAEAGYSQYWVSRIRDRIDRMLHGFTFNKLDGRFSSGAIADDGFTKSTMDKLFAYSMWMPNLFEDPQYPIGHAPSIDWDASSSWTAIVKAVPKSYKTARIIAMEHSYRQFYMQAIRVGLERALAASGYDSFLNIKDQGRNQELAWQGSLSGGYATIDLSAASDSLSRDLAYSVLPRPIVKLLDKYLPKYFSIEGYGEYLMQSFCTSGSAVTFIVESIFFLALVLEVMATVTAFTGQRYAWPRVYGDDLIVDVRLYETVADVLTTLGFTVNPSKSFGEGTLYRESCGAEYFAGFDLTSKYWPRVTMRWRKRDIARTIAELCALQHRLYGCYDAQKFLASVVLTLEPRMTSHEPGVECVDLWDTVPRFLTVDAPCKEGHTAPYQRERHLTLRTRRSNKSAVMGPSGFSGGTVVDMWLYATFLLNGPAYESELHRLLGVSSKPPTRASMHDVGEVYWGYTTE